MTVLHESLSILFFSLPLSPLSPIPNNLLSLFPPPFLSLFSLPSPLFLRQLSTRWTSYSTSLEVECYSRGCLACRPSLESSRGWGRNQWHRNDITVNFTSLTHNIGDYSFDPRLELGEGDWGRGGDAPQGWRHYLLRLFLDDIKVRLILHECNYASNQGDIHRTCDRDDNQ